MSKIRTNPARRAHAMWDGLLRGARGRFGCGDLAGSPARAFCGSPM